MRLPSVPPEAPRSRTTPQTGSASTKGSVYVRNAVIHGYANFAAAAVALTGSALCALQLRQADTNMARGVVIVGPPAGPSLCYCTRMTSIAWGLVVVAEVGSGCGARLVRKPWNPQSTPSVLSRTNLPSDRQPQTKPIEAPVAAAIQIEDVAEDAPVVISAVRVSEDKCILVQWCDV